MQNQGVKKIEEQKIVFGFRKKGSRRAGGMRYVGKEGFLKGWTCLFDPSCSLPLFFPPTFLI